MGKTPMSILISLMAVLNKGQTHYAVISPSTFLNLLRKFHGIDIGDRWLRECQKRLEDAGYIRRCKRYQKNPTSKIKSLPTLFVFTLAGLRLMRKKMIKGADQAIRRLWQWLNGKNKRFPRPEDMIKPSEDEDVKRHLANIWAILNTS